MMRSIGYHISEMKEKEEKKKKKSADENRERWEDPS